MRIAPMTDQHAVAIINIYAEGIATGHATFETSPPDWASFHANHLPEHRFVALDSDSDSNEGNGNDLVLGWVACSRVSPRKVYAGVVEHSVYVASSARGRGAGRALLDALIASTEAAGIWTIQAGVFPENKASLALHAARGFRIVGTRERVGVHCGVWRDVTLIERRSAVVL